MNIDFLLVGEYLYSIFSQLGGGKLELFLNLLVLSGLLLKMISVSTRHNLG